MDHPDGLVRALTSGTLDIVGAVAGASNLTLVATVELRGAPLRCVYKPVRGERPLWDFPGAVLGRREVAAAQLDRALGFGAVPTTVWRPDGPLGPGMVQVWVEADQGRPAPVRLVPADGQGAGDGDPSVARVATGNDGRGAQLDLVHDLDQQVRAICLLDVLMNNADRKGGHLLRGALDRSGRRSGTSRVWAIDHGLCFHREDKLRTVLWGWAGQPLTAAEGDTAAACASLAPGLLGEWLAEPEVAAVVRRAEDLARRGTFPEPDPNWPRLPWPPL